MGIAGSGKSTQAALVAKKIGSARLAVGDLLRAHATAEQAQKMLSGEILPDSELLPLLDAEIQKLRGQQFVLDGSPRTLTQAQWLVSKAQAGELAISDVIHLRISRPAATIRLLARGRPDDNPDAIVERFKEYDDAIMPILEYLKQQGLRIHEVDGEHATTTVAADVEKVLRLKHSHET
jgi:adenylate kinase